MIYRVETLLIIHPVVPTFLSRLFWENVRRHFDEEKWTRHSKYSNIIFRTFWETFYGMMNVHERHIHACAQLSFEPSSLWASAPEPSIRTPIHLFTTTTLLASSASTLRALSRGVEERTTQQFVVAAVSCSSSRNVSRIRITQRALKQTLLLCSLLPLRLLLL